MGAGKQLAGVRSDGSVTQFKPDLKEVKTYPGPALATLRPVSIFWATTYEFFVGYKVKDRLTFLSAFLLLSPSPCCAHVRSEK